MHAEGRGFDSCHLHQMSERTKDWIFRYFCVGFFWAFFAGMFQLAIDPAVGILIWASTFAVNLAFWPVSMISAIYYFMF